jgi:hypothetical protein
MAYIESQAGTAVANSLKARSGMQSQKEAARTERRSMVSDCQRRSEEIEEPLASRPPIPISCIIISASRCARMRAHSDIHRGDEAGIRRPLHDRVPVQGLLEVRPARRNGTLPAGGVQ